MYLYLNNFKYFSKKANKDLIKSTSNKRYLYTLFKFKILSA